MVQLGEPWWWHKEDIAGKPPCFYDQATKDLFEKKMDILCMSFTHQRKT